MPLAGHFTFAPLGCHLQEMFRAAFELGFAFAKLTRQFIDHFVDGGIEVQFFVFGMNIRAGHSEMDFYAVRFGSGLVVKENDMGGNDFTGQMFEMFDFIGDITIDGGSEFEVSGADVDLHIKNCGTICHSDNQ